MCSCANGVADTEEVRKTVDPRIELCVGFVYRQKNKAENL